MQKGIEPKDAFGCTSEGAAITWSSSVRPAGIRLSFLCESFFDQSSFLLPHPSWLRLQLQSQHPAPILVAKAIAVEVIAT